MSKKNYVIGVLLALALFGTGCFRNEPTESLPTAAVEDNSASSATTDTSTLVEVPKRQTNTYVWEDFGISFEYPPEFNVLTTESRDFVYITTEPEIPDSDVVTFFTRLRVAPVTLDVVRKQLMSEPGSNPTQEDVKIGNYTFNKVNVYEGFGGFQGAYYLYQLPEGVFVYKVGREEGALAESILSTINFGGKR